MAAPTGEHTVIVASQLGGPLQAITTPTPLPGQGEVLVRVEWASPGPLENWQKDFGLNIKTWPVFLGADVVGMVVRVGEDVTTLAVGDRVFGFSTRTSKATAFQEYAVLEVRRVGKLPSNLSPQSAAAIPANFVTAYWSLTNYLGLDLPLDMPVNRTPAEHDQPILIWGGATSVGQYAIQLLKLAGYTNVITTASAQHSSLLTSYGARVVIPYSDPSVASQISSAAAEKPIKAILDCVAHDKKTIALYRDVLREGAHVAALLPVQISDESGNVVRVELPDDLSDYFPDGVRATGVRTHFYHHNEVLYEKLQPEFMPRMFAQGLVKPNRTLVVEGESLLARVDDSLRLLREGRVSGEKLVFRVSEELSESA